MDGILAVNKSRGMTSHDVVFKLRKIYGTKKVGHTGTLDPAVDGVLPICIGKATRISEYMMDTGKEYIAEITLGIQTTTEDQTGEVVKRQSIAHITDDMLMEAFQKLTGWIDQTPPMYSAVKVNGRKLYEYARSNQTVERPSRKVYIESIDLLSDIKRSDDTIVFSVQVKCGKGTYIRTLATQIAECVDTVGHMSLLTRTKSGGFKLEDSFTLEALSDMSVEEKSAILRPMADGLQHMPSYIVDEGMRDKILNGQKLKQLNPPIIEETVMYYDEEPIAIYMEHPSKPGIIKARKVFN